MKVVKALKLCVTVSREASNHPGMQIDQDWVIIHDKFPKARLHSLVIARDPKLQGPDDLRKEHLPLLNAMQVKKDCANFQYSTVLNIAHTGKMYCDCRQLKVQSLLYPCGQKL